MNDNAVREAALMAERYQQRINRQKDIIDRYDAFRKWVLADVVEGLEVIEAMAHDYANQGLAILAPDTRRLADRLAILREEIVKRAEVPE